MDMSDRLRKGAALQERVFVTATRVVTYHRRIYKEHPSLRDLSRQLLRSATSVGANLEEADAAQSRADFVSKCTISLKEAREALYWARLIASQFADDDLRATISELNEIVAILTTIVKRSRETTTIAEPREDYEAW
jgi:four helix bundle protein